MALTDEERKALTAALEKVSNEVLTIVEHEAPRLLAKLKDLNSEFPATQAFLKTRGLTHVSQLDTKGMAELMEHLRGVLQKIAN